MEQLRGALRARRDAALETLARELPALAPVERPRGGFNLWLKLPEGVDDQELAGAAERAGLHVNAGRMCFPAEPLGSYLRISYAAAEPAEIRRGIRILAAVLGRMDKD